MDNNSVETHLNNGDYLGTCTSLARNARQEIEINSEQSGEYITIIPNPVTAKFSLLLSLPYDSKIKIELYDVTGKRIATILKANLIKDNMITFEYDVSMFSESLFLCRITTDKKVINRIVIKTK